MASSKRDRSHEQTADLDLALDSIVTKLQAATHDDKDSLTALLVDVLNVDAATATFYLEASNLNPHAAVQLHMQQANMVHTDGPSVVKRSKPKPEPPTLASVPVTVAGTPEGWCARLSTAGTIVFVHNESGHEQLRVPPGFEPHAPTPSDGSSTVDGGDCEMPERKDKVVDWAQASAPEADSPPDAFEEQLPHNTKAPPPSSEPAAVTAQLRHHAGVICDSCEGHVYGSRFQCLTRVNFDLCEKCMWSEHVSQWREGHSFLKMSFVDG